MGDYYYSRSATPVTFFNQNRHELRSESVSRGMSDGGARFAREYLAAMDGASPLDKMLYVDTKTWLPDDLLIKADKMTMANSVELRVPFLDHHVLEFAAGLPPDYKLKGMTTKRILKAALNERVPAAILNRPKAGFPLPYARWIRNELREPIRDLLTDRSTIQRGYFSGSVIERMLDRNSTREDYSKEIFSLVVLELWHRIFTEQRDVVFS
jgi:asparagine synthase (glutamine-hydrolysing)